jgi:signal transduction histidine kinase
MNDITGMEKQLQKMLSIIYQTPVGIVETDITGTILQMNAKGVQLLMPFLTHFGIADENNLFSLLDKIVPAVSAAIHSFNKESGTIIKQQNYQIELTFNGKANSLHFFFTVTKIDSNTISFMFDDITPFYEREKIMNKALQDQAVEKTKFEIASGVLHDIGNAVVGFGSYLTRIKRELAQTDHDTLINLEKFFCTHQPLLIQTFGEAKTNALLDLLAGLVHNQKSSQAELNKALSEQMNIITHVSEILTLQRQYIKGQEGERAKISIRNILNDCLAMLMPVIQKKNILVQSSLPIDIPLLTGDKTRLMQVFLNLLKNAAESIQAGENVVKRIEIQTRVENNELLVIIKDTGAGIEPSILPDLFTKGFTTKTEGTGLGLANCRSIVESHNGRITLQSEGAGKGAKVTVYFKL